MKTPQIKKLTISGNKIEIYHKFEVVLSLEAGFNNPYDYSDILVQATFVAPSGVEQQIDGFFMQDFELDTVAGNLISIGNGGFKIRFAPNEIGKWFFSVQVKDRNGSTQSEKQFFECTSTSSPINEGFVRRSNTKYLQFDSGAPLFLIGENMAWHSTNPYLDYKKWLKELSFHGGNFIRLWHAHWGLGIEWTAARKGFDGLRHYHQENSFFQDWLFDFCAEKGILIMLTLQHHGPFSTRVDSNWDENPYNQENGGPCAQPIDFFKKQEAIAHTQNRFRYILARWGYSRSILAWELFNEVDWVDDLGDNLESVLQWHSNMATFIKQVDPNQHLVSTSFDDENKADKLWRDQNIDIVQIHHYEEKPNIESTLVQQLQTALQTYQKPVLIAEFSLGTKAEELWIDPKGIHIHNALWASTFGGGIGIAMSWWWDVYIHPKNLYEYFLPISQLVLQFDFVAKDMRPFHNIQIQQKKEKNRSGFFRKLWRWLTFRGFTTTEKTSSNVAHYSLISADKSTILGFIQNKGKTHQNKANQSIINGIELVIDGVLQKEHYLVNYYDSIQMSILNSIKIQSLDGQIRLDTPTFEWAIIYTVEKMKPIRIEV